MQIHYKHYVEPLKPFLFGKKVFPILEMPKKLDYIDLQLVCFGFLTIYTMKSIFIITNYMHTSMQKTTS